MKYHRNVQRKNSIMNARLVLFLAAVASAVAMQSAMASALPHVITLRQLDGVHTGASVSRVCQILGAPEDITRWVGGQRSMVYEIYSHNDMQELVYIDLDHNARVRAIHILSRE